jgi:hypothetical protein
MKDISQMKAWTSGGNSLFPVGGEALEKAVFIPLIGQNVRKFVIFHEGGGGGGGRPAPPRFPPLAWTPKALVANCILIDK